MSSGKLHATKYLTFNDFAYGLPALLLSCEVLLITPFFFFAFDPTQYIIGKHDDSKPGPIPHEYYGGPLGIKAILEGINVFDIVMTLSIGMKAKLASAAAARAAKANRKHGKHDHGHGHGYANGRDESSHGGEMLNGRV